jgi:hypothetical protein
MSGKVLSELIPNPEDMHTDDFREHLRKYHLDIRLNGAASIRHALQHVFRGKAWMPYNGHTHPAP